MATFHAKGKVKLIIPFDEFGISYVIEKCMYGMFGFHLKIVHVSKDDAYDADNNVIGFIYQVSIIGDLDLEWKVNSERFKIIAKNLPRSSLNTVFMLKIVAFVANVILHFVEIK
jgi:hypothetical protein